MGKIARMPGTGRPKGVRRTKRRGDGGKRSRLRESRRIVILTWSILVGLAVVVVLGLAVWLWLIPQMTRKVEGNMTRTAVELEKEATVTPKFPSPSEVEALGMVKAALAVREAERVTDYFRIGSATPEAVVGFLRDLDRVEGAFVRSEWLGSINANDLPLDGVLITFQGSEKLRKRLVLLTADAAGKWKLDFDAFARTVSPAWGEILAGTAPAVSVVRVYVAKDNYFNGLFSDEALWECYCLASPDTDQISLGYCKKISPQTAALQRIFSREQKILRATLEIRRVDGTESRQFEISRVLAEDWVIGPVPFDENFR